MKKHKKSEPHNREEHVALKHKPPTGVQPAPENAHMSGHSHSMQRRLLRLNSEGKQAERHPDLPAGLHSTGSFTDANEK